MRTYWWNAGPHAEPEGQLEREALMVLWKSIVRGRVLEETVKNSEGSTGLGGSSVHGLDGIVTSQKISPCGVVVDL